MLFIASMICLVHSLGCVDGGAEYKMDQSLEGSTASYLGESAGDLSGNNVAGVGDVNGDGYDDILISAIYSDGGATDNGQVYLFLGGSSGFSMDTRLSDADASFWGEKSGDNAGSRIVGVGDVNGDGFDDFLIGALRNDDGGPDAGKVYLILGRASGWAMDTSLSNANASFLGYGNFMYLPHAMAGAGDVNGDGYNDILIGVYQDNEAGYEAGQVYLIFGRTSGWTSNTALSASNASFLGEASLDYAGSSVAGVGDVNGDGYDDIMIGAPGHDDVVAKSGQAYLVLGRSSGWTMDTSLSNSNGSFMDTQPWQMGQHLAGAGDVNGDEYDDILIGTGYHNTGQYYLVLGKASGWEMDILIGNVTEATFKGESSYNWLELASGTGDVNNDGYDDLLFGASGNGERAHQAGQVYLILGRKTGWPSIGNSNASFQGEKREDFLGRGSAWAGDFNGDGYDDILVGAAGNDENGNLSGQTYLICYDYLPPQVLNVTAPEVATTGDLFSILASVYDNVRIANVTVEYWFGDSQDHINQSAVRSSGDEQNGTWNVGIAIPSDSTEPLHYIVHVRDTMDFLVSTMEVVVLVIDDDPPSMLRDGSDSLATTGDPFLFLVDVVDNINLTSVRVEYWYGSGVPENVSLIDGIGDKWSLTVRTPTDSTDMLHYFFYAADVSNNVITSPTRDVTVRDDDLPVIGEDVTLLQAFTGDEFTFAVNAFDNIEVGEVEVSYSYGERTTAKMHLSDAGGGMWEATITTEHTLEDIEYVIVVRDTSGNENETDPRTVTIIDNDDPEVIEDLSDTTATTGDVFTARLRVRDNIRIDTVKSGNDTWDGTVIDENRNGVFEIVILMKEDYVGPFVMTVKVKDLVGNEIEFELLGPNVVDNDPPEVEYDHTIGEHPRGLNLTLSINTTDNIGVEHVFLVYQFGDGQNVNLTIELYPVLLTIPRLPGGDLYFKFSAVDEEGNWNSTGEYSTSLVNVAPTISDLPDWDLEEGLYGGMPLASYIEDINGDPVTISCSDSDITVNQESKLLQLHHDTYVPERMVTVTVSDGEAVATATLKIIVINVNDQPIIIELLPADRTRIKEDQRVVLSVSVDDEDGDEVTVTWMDGDQVLGIGSPLEVSLRPGTRLITVSVDDGTERVDQSTTIIVSEVEESSGLLWVLLVVILSIGAVAAIIILRRRN